MQKISESKSYKIQVLRGLAVTAVVFIHNTPGGIAQVWCRPFINFPVGMFLFLSGMLSCAENRNPGKRILKVAVPYIIWTFIYVLIENFKKPSQIPGIYIKDLITAESAVIMYYVFVYCESTLLIPLIDKLARSGYKWIGFLISPLEITVMRLLPIVSGYEVNKYIRIIMNISCLGWFTYYYLGYLLGNGFIKLKLSASRIIMLWAGAIILQIAEGYWYYSMGELNCGTQLKLTAISAGSLFTLLAYRYIYAENAPAPEILHFLGDYSFGIFFAHLMVMTALKHIPHYRGIVIYPFNAVVTVAVTSLFAVVGKRILGKNSKYLAL